MPSTNALASAVIVFGASLSSHSPQGEAVSYQPQYPPRKAVVGVGGGGVGVVVGGVVGGGGGCEDVV